MPEPVTINRQEIENRIFTIRGVQVMLDRDLALFYDVKSIRLREQVKRNRSRFPEDFMFQLTEDEASLMVSQNAIPSKQHMGGYLPYVFTEQGVAGVSAILKSEKAVDVSIKIIRAFIAMRKFIINNAALFQRLDKVELKQIEVDQKFEKLFKALDNNEIPERGIFFDGQIFDAYTLIADIIRKAKTSIVLIDNYVDDTVLNLFTKRKERVDLTIYTKNISRQLALDLDKHNAQYEPIIIKEFKDAHDRFLILDNKTVYHFGASLKDLGKKWFAFSKMETTALDMLNKLNEKKFE